jgi:hypothetical protein
MRNNQTGVCFTLSFGILVEAMLYLASLACFCKEQETLANVQKKYEMSVCVCGGGGWVGVCARD